MLIMILTGIYIHDPNWMPIFSSIGVVWPLHYIFAIVLVATVFVRILYSAYIGDFEHLAIKSGSLKDLGPVITYYLFLTDDEPDQGKYNAGQRLTYSVYWIVLLAIQVGTGLALYITIADVPLRILHYLVTWAFIASIVIHVYLGAVHGWGVIKSMITGKLPETES
jgi:Ni/Fe-hydrogenase 1 B-type cytochrome subunit